LFIANIINHKGVIHTIFFHRLFNPLHPSTHEVLDITLPYVSDPDIESLIEQRTNSLIRQLDVASNQSSPQYGSKPTRGQIVVQFLERKRRKGWFVAKADEETVWETWIVEITLTSARSEPEAERNRRQIEGSLQKAAMKVITFVNEDRNHIPPITSNETNPFPYQVLVNPKNDGWGTKMGIF